MGITYNPGSGLRNVPEIKINVGGTLRNVIEVWENVGGVLKQVYPDTAYDGSHFAGELRGGVLTNGIFAKDSETSLSGHAYEYMNNYHDGNTTVTISSGGLYRNVDNWAGTRPDYETYGHPFGFMSKNTISFSGLKSMRITGKVDYLFTQRAQDAGSITMSQYLTIEPVYYTGSRYVRRGSNAKKSSMFAVWNASIGEGGTSTASKTFDVTFDISGWTTTDYIGFYWEPYVATSALDFQREKMDLTISRIEFIK